MEHAASPSRTTWVQPVSNVLLSALWLFFAIAHIAAFGQTGKASLLVFATAETLVAMFFLLRTQPKTHTTRPIDWVAAVAGTSLPLLIRPTADTPLPLAEWGLILGSVIQIAGILSLNRSFAIVPALRQLKCGGMYSLVRHPIYASYLVTFVFYLAGNFSTWNLVVIASSVCLMVTRIHFEERHLALDAEYRNYRERVRWRLIPFVF